MSGYTVRERTINALRPLHFACSTPQPLFEHDTRAGCLDCYGISPEQITVATERIEVELFDLDRPKAPVLRVLKFRARVL